VSEENEKVLKGKLGPRKNNLNNSEDEDKVVPMDQIKMN
jgi:hypothetical protein